MNAQQAAELTFLALCLWREARGECSEARLAIAYVVLTRVGLRTWFGHDILSVLFKDRQFSSLTFHGDPQLNTWPDAADPSWKDSLFQAAVAIGGAAANPCPTADSYYDTSIQPPIWTAQGTFIRQIGRLRFYRTVELDSA